jgi:lipopolysaccharide/colanic/teichoic acid biosynthesis glycosyltransferase
LGSAAAHSLLLTPLDRGTILGHLLAQLRAVSHEEATVLATFAVCAAYERAIQAATGHDLAVIGHDRFAELLDSREPADWLLLLDASHFPANGFDLADMLPTPPVATLALHWVSVTNGTCSAQECVHLDAAGRVRRIQRYYDGVTWRNTCGITGSLVSVASARTTGWTTLTSLSDLRQELVRRGVPANDVCSSAGAIDLREEQGLLRLTERRVRAVTSGAALPQRHATEHVSIGQDCDIHPSVRVHGHVVIQDRVVIEAGARIIGPALLGVGARIDRGASLAHCLVLPDVVVPPEATLRGRVFSGNGGAAAAAGTPRTPLRRSAPADPLAQPSGGREYVRIKQALDGAVALLGLLALAPLFVVVAAIIKLTSRGPVFFGQGREGREGREFRCWKFRTMVVGADAQQRALYRQNAVDGPQFKLEHDPRTTRLGHWLRKSNIDELPQLFNVLLGHMSLIGPRPSPFRENQICVPWRQARLSVRPGITGLWQLCRHERDAGDFHQWIYYDMLYVRHMSFWLDLKILIATLATFGGRWSVPVSLMIPNCTLQEQRDLGGLLDWAPVVDGIRSRPATARPEPSYGSM